VGRTVTVEISAKVQGFVAGLSSGVRSVKEFAGELDTLGTKHKDKFNQLALSAGALGVTLVGAFGAIVKSAADFDREMSAVASVSNASEKSLGQLRDAALQAGKDTVYSATEAAQAEEELAKAGVSTSDILGGALTGSLSLASAGSLDLADAATIAAQAMNTFHLNGQNVGHIADVLSAGANKSAADVKQLGDALRQGGLVASQTGLTLEDTVGTLSAFADRALIGSDAGTSLKTMLQALANPSQQSAALMKQLGINAYDTRGQFIGITNLAQNLQAALGNLTQAQRNAALAQIFGSDATRSATVLYNLGADGLQNYIDAVNDQGAASETARKKLDNLAGDVEQLRGSLETLAITSGSGVNSGLRTLTQGATGLINVFLGLPKPIQETVTILAGVSGAGLVAASGLAKARQSGLEFLDTLKNMGPAGEKAAAGVSAVAKIAGTAGLVGSAIAIGIVGLQAIGEAVAKQTKPIERDINDLTTSLEKFASSGKFVGEMAAITGGNLKKWANSLEALQERMAIATWTRDAGEVQKLSKQYQQTASDTKAMDTALAQLVQNGQATQAKIAFDQIAQSLSDASLKAWGVTVPVSEIEKQFPQYMDAVNGAAVANSGLAAGFGDTAANARTMSSTLQDAIDHGQTLTDVFKQLHGAAEDFARGEIDFKQKIADLSQALAENGHGLDINTQKGRDNMSAILDAVDAAEKAAQAKLDETGSVQQASDTYNAYIDQLKATLHAAHFTDDQINQLIAAYAQMPPAVSTTVSAPGLSGALHDVEHYRETLRDINGKTYSATVTVYTHGDTNLQIGPSGAARYRRWGGYYEHAQDGLLRDAQVSSPVMPARYAYAEPATGGEAFIPKFGDYGRSMDTLNHAAGWYGAQVVPGGAAYGGGSAGGTVEIILSGGDASTAAWLGIARKAVKDRGGNVQFVLTGRTG
jgi:TP901 family phage tail tape measure protein